MSELISPIIYQLGIGGILGVVVGYAVKKVLKILALIAGLFALTLIYLGYTGIISVNYTNLAGAIGGLLGNLGGASQWLSPIIANLPFGGSFVVGATMGFKKG